MTIPTRSGAWRPTLLAAMGASALTLAISALPRDSESGVPTIDVAAIAQLIDQISTLARQIQHLTGIELSMETIVATLGETTDVMSYREQVGNDIDTIRSASYHGANAGTPPRENDPAAENAEVPGIPEFATEHEARSWAVERYFIELKSTTNAAEQATLGDRITTRNRLRAEDHLQIATAAYAMASDMQSSWETEHDVRAALDERLGDAQSLREEVSLLARVAIEQTRAEAQANRLAAEQLRLRALEHLMSVDVGIEEERYARLISGTTNP